MGLSAINPHADTRRRLACSRQSRISSFPDPTSVRRLFSSFRRWLHSGGDHGESLHAQSLLASRVEIPGSDGVTTW
jgi:hypothetical protein